MEPITATSQREMMKITIAVSLLWGQWACNQMPESAHNTVLNGKQLHSLAGIPPSHWCHNPEGTGWERTAKQCMHGKKPPLFMGERSLSLCLYNDISHITWSHCWFSHHLWTCYNWSSLSTFANMTCSYQDYFILLCSGFFILFLQYHVSHSCSFFKYSSYSL